MKYIFDVPVLVRSKKNHRPIYINRKTGKPFLGKGDALQDFEETCAILLNIQKNKLGIREPLKGSLRVNYLFEFKGNTAGDVDNFMASVNDVMEAGKGKFKVGIFQNDSQIEEGSFKIRRNTGLIDRIVIEIEPISVQNVGSTSSSPSV